MVGAVAKRSARQHGGERGFEATQPPPAAGRPRSAGPCPGGRRRAGTGTAPRGPGRSRSRSRRPRRARRSEPSPMPIQAQRIRPDRCTPRIRHAAPAASAIRSVAVLDTVLVRSSPPAPAIRQAANTAVAGVTAVPTGCRRGSSTSTGRVSIPSPPLPPGRAWWHAFTVEIGHAAGHLRSCITGPSREDQNLLRYERTTTAHPPHPSHRRSPHAECLPAGYDSFRSTAGSGAQQVPGHSRYRGTAGTGAHGR
jgi:hypothetical protein